MKSLTAQVLSPTAPIAPSHASDERIDAEALHDLLLRSERDLLVARERIRRMASKISFFTRQVAQLDGHGTVLEAEVQTLREQASRREADVRELEDRLTISDRTRDDAVAALSQCRTDRAHLGRDVADLRPRARSNLLAMQALSAARAECDVLRHELAACCASDPRRAVAGHGPARDGVGRMRRLLSGLLAKMGP